MTEQFPLRNVLQKSWSQSYQRWTMTQPFRRSRRDTDRDQEILLRIRERLQQIKRRLLDIEARVDALRTTDKAVTLREFTEKQLNGKRSDDQETYASHPRTAVEKYIAG
jgi:hypothetical protein